MSLSSRITDRSRGIARDLQAEEFAEGARIQRLSSKVSGNFSGWHHRGSSNTDLIWHCRIVETFHGCPEVEYLNDKSEITPFPASTVLQVSLTNLALSENSDEVARPVRLIREPDEMFVLTASASIVMHMFEGHHQLIRNPVILFAESCMRRSGSAHADYRQ